MFEGQFSPHGTLALYSRVLGEPQPDWPPNVTTTGTVFYNGPEPLEPKLEEFLAAGEPPVVFTLGTSAVGAAGRFYHESAAAAAKLGVRAVLLTGGFAQNRPDDLPPNVLLVDRAPHQLLFPRASAVVHQCGAGTTAQALRAGQPTLLVPHGHDQFDNARRVRKLGVARTVFPTEYRAERVARDLRALLTDPSYRERAAATRRSSARNAAPRRPSTSSSTCSLRRRRAGATRRRPLPARAAPTRRRGSCRRGRRRWRPCSRAPSPRAPRAKLRQRVDDAPRSMTAVTPVFVARSR